MRTLLPAAVALALTACSSGYKNDTLKIELKPPSGFSVDQETPNSVSFSGGLEIVSVPGTLPQIGAVPLNNLAEQALADGKRTMPGNLQTSSTGDLGGAKTARFEYKSDTERGLLYVLPRANRFLLVRFVSPGSSYGQKEASVERALGTLKIRD